jgi:hypothetical protein
VYYNVLQNFNNAARAPENRASRGEAVLLKNRVNRRKSLTGVKCPEGSISEIGDSFASASQRFAYYSIHFYQTFIVRNVAESKGICTEKRYP